MEPEKNEKKYEMEENISAFLQAAKEGNNGRLKTLLDEDVYINAKDEDGMTALHLAAAAGQEATVDFLLKNDANIAAQNKLGRTALFEAAGAGQTDVVIYLIAKGAVPTAKDKQGRTLMRVAAEQGHTDTVQVLLGYGLAVEQTDEDGMTPLHGAAAGGHVGTLKFLLKNGANIEALDKSGRTPLMAAVENGHVETVKFLIDKEIRPQTKNIDGETSIMVTAEDGYMDAVSPSAQAQQSSSGPSAYSRPVQNGEVPFAVTMNKESITNWTILYTIAYFLVLFFTSIFGVSYFGLVSDEEFMQTNTQEQIDEALLGISIIFFVFFIPCGIFKLVAFYYYLLRLWESIPAEFARTTPQNAATYSLIPAYCWYWWFQSFAGLVQDMNKATEQYGRGQVFNAGLIKGVCIYWAIVGVIGMAIDRSSSDATIPFSIFLGIVDLFITVPVIWWLRRQVFTFLDMKPTAQNEVR